MPKPLVELNETQKKELWDSFNLLDPEGTGAKDPLGDL